MPNVYSTIMYNSQRLQSPPRWQCPALLVACCLLGTLLPFSLVAETFQLKSPDGRLVLQLDTDQQLQYQLAMDGQPLILPSAINLSFADGGQFGANAEVLRQQQTTVDEEVAPQIQLRTALIRNHYNELTLDFKQHFSLQLRAFNEGVAYRFIGKQPGTAELKSEQANFNFAPGTYSYFPFEKDFRTATQPTFTPLPAKNIDGAELGSLPALFVTKGVNLLLTETDLQDYPGLWLKGHGDGRIYGVHPFDLDNKGELTNKIAQLSRQRNYPWRIIGVARSDAELFNIQLSYLLAEPSRIGAPGWIKPGKIAWDWYNENNFKGVDFKAGINTETYKYYADFAAKFGIENILIDDGWSSHDDVLTVLPTIDVQAIIQHAKSKGVAVQLWVPWTGLDKNMAAAMALYKKWGVTGLKIDFMNSDSQSMVNFYWRAAAMAAKYQLMVNFHGAYKPAGIHRTYPNVLTREGVKGLENHKWSDVITPAHNLHIPFIRMIAGPMDYTPGAMRNAHRKDFNAVFSRPMSLGTRAHQLAMFVLYESPLQMLADTPSSYLAEPDIPAFISKIPTVWDNFKVLHANIGEYLVMARQRGNHWYLGGMTNDQPRSLPVVLDFLPPGTYQLTLMKDGINAERHAEDYKLEKRVVKSGDTLDIPMVGGGGFAAILTPL
jgi:alpha-glucosidase